MPFKTLWLAKFYTNQLHTPQTYNKQTIMFFLPNTLQVHIYVLLDPKKCTVELYTLVLDTLLQ
jgi:hypothetical protein